jgi:hypothetical protein
LPPPLEKQALAPMDQAQSMMSQYFIPHIELECRQIGLSFRRLRSSDHKKQPLVRSCEEEGEKEEGGGGGGTKMGNMDRERRHVWAREGGSGALRGIQAGVLRFPPHIKK